MRFTLATVVFSLAAMVVAAPTNGIDARGGGTTCAFGQTAQCCSSTSVSSNAGLLGLPSLVDGLNCKFYIILFASIHLFSLLVQSFSLITDTGVPITILAAILDNPGCNQQQVCCPSSQGVSFVFTYIIFLYLT